MRAKSVLLKHDVELMTQTNSTSSASLIYSLLNQTGYYDLAISIALKFKLDLTPMFESVATRCFQLANLHSNASSSSGSNNSIAKSSEWLQYNTLPLTSRDVVDSAWKLLESYLQNFDSRETNFVHHKDVASRLLSLDRRVKLPQWLVNSYKVRTKGLRKKKHF